MLEISNVSKKYGSKRAVDNVSMNIEPGHIYGLLGPNGSGKSTWMKMAANLIVPDGGGILLDGIRAGKTTKAHIAYMPTEPFFYDYMTGKNAAGFYQDFYEDFDMEKFFYIMDSLKLDPNQKIKTMSSGMTAKFKIGITMSRNAKIFLLDEPLNGIDLLARDEILSTIIEHTRSNSALVVSSHLIEELERVIDTAMFMKNGQLVLMGDVEELRQSHGESVVDLYRRIYA